MFMKHASSLHPAIKLLQAVTDPTSADEAAAASTEVERLLAARFPEETAGEAEGPFRGDYASARLDGAVDLLEDTRRLAVQAGACPEFLAVIDRVLKEAREALFRAVVAAAPATPPAAAATPNAAAWAKAALITPEINPVPEFLRDI